MEYIIKALVLGLVQGLTEFLPVSSSGHLTIFSHLFGFNQEKPDITLEVLLHFGTLVAVVVYYRKDVLEIAREFIRMIGAAFSGGIELNKYPHRRLCVMLIIATVPAFVFGFLFKDLVEQMSGNLALVGLALVTTGIILWFSDRIVSGKQNMKDASMGSAIMVGIFQAVAILPGISRSGMTIVGGLLSGMEREFAIKFSFLMSIPVILGATVLDVVELLRGSMPSDFQLLPALVGVALAAIVGYLTISLLINLIKRAKLVYFAVYCGAIGMISVIVSFTQI